jgi:hypothetical protein
MIDARRHRRGIQALAPRGHRPVRRRHLPVDVPAGRVSVAFACRRDRFEGFVESRGHRCRSHVAEAQVEQLVDVRLELSLQPSVLPDRPGEGIDQVGSRFALAQRRPAVRQKQPAPCRMRGYRSEHVIGNGSHQQPVERDLEGGTRPGGLEPDRATGRGSPQNRRPRPQAGLLDLAGALEAGGGSCSSSHDMVELRHAEDDQTVGPYRPEITGREADRQALQAAARGRVAGLPRSRRCRARTGSG